MGEEILGRRYGHLTQVGKTFRNSRKDYAKALFMCDCGNMIAVNKKEVLEYHLFDRCKQCKELEELKHCDNSK